MNKIILNCKYVLFVQWENISSLWVYLYIGYGPKKDLDRLLFPRINATALRLLAADK